MSVTTIYKDDRVEKAKKRIIGNWQRAKKDHKTKGYNIYADIINLIGNSNYYGISLSDLGIDVNDLKKMYDESLDKIKPSIIEKYQDIADSVFK